MKKIIACVAVSLMLTGAASAQWSENFNGGGAFPPAGWSVDDLLGSSFAVGWDYNYNLFDGADPRGNFSSGDGGAAHIDTDIRPSGVSGAYNKALVTPSFTVPGGGATLDFVLHYAPLGGDSANVEINDGSGWANLATYTTSQGTFPTFPYSADVALGVAKSLDISTYAGSDAQVRFRYAGTGWNWWMQVDNVAVTPEPASLALLALGGLALIRRR